MRVLVTGASGFLGSSLALKLKELGNEVCAVSRTKAASLLAAGINWQPLDLAVDFSNQNYQEIFSGVEAVFHVAAKVDMWGDYDDFYQTNVLGTQQIIDACKKFGVKYLIYTSSPSVVADGSDLVGVNEEYPKPSKYKAYYPQTKSMAEDLVLAANSAELRTLSLRPHLIFGPNDQNLIPTVLERADAGKLLQIGAGNNLCDFSYIDDCVQAHVKSLAALEVNAAEASGRAYFISQGEPWSLWEWINTLLTLTNRPKISRKISYGLAMFIAKVLEFVHKNFLPKKEPLLSCFLVSEMATSHYFDITAARRLLGYDPQWKMLDALQLSAQAFKK